LISRSCGDAGILYPPGRPDHTPQATELVHEGIHDCAEGGGAARWRNRSQFLLFSAQSCGDWWTKHEGYNCGRREAAGCNKSPSTKPMVVTEQQSGDMMALYEALTRNWKPGCAAQPNRGDKFSRPHVDEDRDRAECIGSNRGTRVGVARGGCIRTLPDKSWTFADRSDASRRRSANALLDVPEEERPKLLRANAATMKTCFRKSNGLFKGSLRSQGFDESPFREASRTPARILIVGRLSSIIRC